MLKNCYCKAVKAFLRRKLDRVDRALHEELVYRLDCCSKITGRTLQKIVAARILSRKMLARVRRPAMSCTRKLLVEGRP